MCISVSQLLWNIGIAVFAGLQYSLAYVILLVGKAKLIYDIYLTLVDNYISLIKGEPSP